MGALLALHTIHLDLILATTYDPVSPIRNNF